MSFFAGDNYTIDVNFYHEAFSFNAMRTFKISTSKNISQISTNSWTLSQLSDSLCLCGEMKVKQS